MEASQAITAARPLHIHIGRVGAGAIGVGVLAASDAVLGALVAGCFTLVNTGLTLWLSGRQDRRKQRQERRRRRRREREDENE